VDEAQLIQASRQGDVSAFNRLVLAYQQTIYNLAFRMLGEAEAAADITQEAFISAFRSLASFRDGSFKGWLLRIATNACYDQLRQRRRHPLSSLEDLVEVVEKLPSPEAGPDEYALRRELADEIQRGLATLPPEQRVVVIMSDVQGFSYEDIAQATNTSLGTVKSRLSRGRAHLRDYLAQKRELLPVRYRLSM
jgi:RNA polymerase sigma-70 factor (ECF subfamily)